MQGFDFAQRHMLRVAARNAQQREKVIRCERGRNVPGFRRIKFAARDIHARHIQHPQKAGGGVDGLAAQPRKGRREVIQLAYARGGQARNTVFTRSGDIHLFG